jgi:hypothetical protein
MGLKIALQADMGGVSLAGTGLGSAISIVGLGWVWATGAAMQPEEAIMRSAAKMIFFSWNRFSLDQSLKLKDLR